MIGGPQLYVPNIASAAFLLSGKDFLPKGVDAGAQDILLIAPDEGRLNQYTQLIKDFNANLDVLVFPPWDCVPYDRVGAKNDVTAQRLATLVKLVKAKRKGPRVLLTTIRAVIQKVPPVSFIKSCVKVIAPGKRIDRSRLINLLERGGYSRSDLVSQIGEYAVRGGLIDLFPPGYKHPLRLDFFDDTLETIRPFDLGSQRSLKKINRCAIMPIYEFAFDEDAIARFRAKYLEVLGVPPKHDSLYQAVSSGQRYQGMEHWLPFFHDHLETLFDYIPQAKIILDYQWDMALNDGVEQVADHFNSRHSSLEEVAFGAASYVPVPKEMMFLDAGEFQKACSKPYCVFNEFLSDDAAKLSNPAGQAGAKTNIRLGKKFHLERGDANVNLGDALKKHLTAEMTEGQKIIVACRSKGSLVRMENLLRDVQFAKMKSFDRWDDAFAHASKTQVALVPASIDEGFVLDDLTILSEQDVFGTPNVRTRRKRKKGREVLSDAQSLSVGDYVVHADHGIGRFDGLKTVEVSGAQHDCIELTYANDGRLYLPVENIELLSRYGSDDVVVQLDRLGGSGWQARKARIKSRIKEIAGELMKVAAARLLKTAPVLRVEDDVYNGFVARFPYDETEDQQDAIEDVLSDLEAGKPMDRLICGDVGFGKTEVALRGSFVTAMSGKQVAVIAPTTLLARQHFHTFRERFKGTPVKVGHLSRLVTGAQAKDARERLAIGDLDIIVGTHALLGKLVKFHDLGLVVVDEEQRFGVKHKERLKQLKDDVHVLTLSATPIPRTLQMALTGVRDLSLITTPPVDRLAVRTYVSPFDPMILREALLREKMRGGQSFFVCPRIDDLEEALDFLRTHTPELKVAVAHGQLPPRELEDIMNGFYDRQYHVLLATTIVESGLDVESANTLVIYRADMFGLSQLYQLRGRVGRSKTRAYAYLTIQPNKQLTSMGEKRLKVMNSLDGLGAGFNLASYDLDMRGGGNLVGEEQSGHIKEVGFELYQAMLEEAIGGLKGDEDEADQGTWSPSIALGVSVLIPETYVKDLDLRLSLYRRLANFAVFDDIQDFAVELHDRFGPPPEETRHLFNLAEIKLLCRAAFVETVEAGELGCLFAFRAKSPIDVAKLLAFVETKKGKARILPDEKLVVKGDWGNVEERIRAVKSILKELAKYVTKPS